MEVVVSIQNVAQKMSLIFFQIQAPVGLKILLKKKRFKVKNEIFSEHLICAFWHSVLNPRPFDAQLLAD